MEEVRTKEWRRWCSTSYGRIGFRLAYATSSDMNLPPTDLLFSIDPGESTWTVIGPTPGGPPHVIPSPLGDSSFLGLLSRLRLYGDWPLPLDGNDTKSIEEAMAGLAGQISERITSLLLSDAARPVLIRRLNQVHRRRTRLTIQVADRGFLGDQILALPWELVAPEPGFFPVRQGLLEVVRESIVDGAPELPEPSGPLAVAVVVAAPEEQSALAYEKEELRLQTALAPLGHAVAFSDLGTLDDLAELVDEHRATAILFSGHGLPGKLLFENELGFANEVGIEEVMRRLRTLLLKPGRGGAFPCLFFLSSCLSATGSDDPDTGRPPSLLGGGPSTAATLHRAGFPQVIGYFGTVRESQAGRAEQTFFTALARGETALQAAHEARASLIDPFEQDGERFFFPLGWTQLAVYHRGPDRPIARGGPRRGRALPPRLRRRTEERNGLPVLVHGFVGHRGLQHEVLRRVRRGERLIVLQGPGGGGKTALACHILTRTLAPEPADQLLLRTRALDEVPDPLLELRLQAEEHGRKHALPTLAGGTLTRTVRALQAARPSLAVYLDRVDLLQAGPGTDSAPESWRPGAEAVWGELEALAAEGVPVIVSTRFAGAEVPVRSHVAVSPLSPADALRMMSFFEELSDLPPGDRQKLVDWMDGHPGTFKLLNGALAGQRNRLGLGYEVTDPWRELVEPVLGEVARQVRTELGLAALWQGLSETAREHARRIAGRPEPLPAQEVDALGEARDPLVRRGLLVRYREQVRKDEVFQWRERWGLPLRLRELIAAEPADG